MEDLSWSACQLGNCPVRPSFEEGVRFNVSAFVELIYAISGSDLEVDRAHDADVSWRNPPASWTRLNGRQNTLKTSCLRGVLEGDALALMQRMQ